MQKNGAAQSADAAVVSEAQALSAKEQLGRALASLPGMREVEALVDKKLLSDSPLLHEIGTYLLKLGGKRMRPALTLLVAKALGVIPAPQAVIDVAAGIELIHMATLLHDDIIDRSPKRRHQASPFVKYGVESSLLCGDFLLTRAFSLCARLDAFVIDATERACMDLTEGEIMETSLVRERHSIASSLEIARKKTAALFRLGAISAAHLVQDDTVVTNELGHFGEKLGIAFQILDDILDVTASEETLGKRSGIDIHERKPSLVNVLWLDSGSKSSLRLTTAVSGDEDEFIESALVELRTSPVIEQARHYARRYAAEAEAHLSAAMIASKSRNDEGWQALKTIISYTLARVE